MNNQEFSVHLKINSRTYNKLNLFSEKENLSVEDFICQVLENYDHRTKDRTPEVLAFFESELKECIKILEEI